MQPTDGSKGKRGEASERRTGSVLRIIRENPGLTAEDIGTRLGDVPARMVRECIHRLRRAGEPITIFQTASGYVHLDDVKDPAMKASIVKAHRERTRSYMGDHAALMRQIGRMTAAEVAMQGLFDMLIPDEASTRDTRPSTMADVARLPVQYRKNVTNLLVQLLDGIATDPEAFRYEQAILADKFGGVFLTKEKAAKLAAARKALEDVGV